MVLPSTCLSSLARRRRESIATDCQRIAACISDTLSLTSSPRNDDANRSRYERYLQSVAITRLIPCLNDIVADAALSSFSQELLNPVKLSPSVNISLLNDDTSVSSAAPSPINSQSMPCSPLAGMPIVILHVVAFESHFKFVISGKIRVAPPRTRSCSPPRKRRDLLPMRARRILESFIEMKLSNVSETATIHEMRNAVKASSEEKTLLVGLTQLGIKQVTTWLSNTRKRHVRADRIVQLRQQVNRGRQKRMLRPDYESTWYADLV